MQAAQFYKGKINGFEDNYESSNLIEFLSLDKLSDLRDYDNTSKPYRHFFKVERVMALTEAYLVKSGDDAGRDGIRTRGVLYKFDKDVLHDGFNYLFPEEQFLKDLNVGKYKLKMPSLPKELTKPLDTPPLEWEVQT